MSGIWNASDKSAAIVLSNGNLTASIASTTNSGVRGTTSHDRSAGGKWYIEFASITIVSSNAGIGFATSSWSLTGTSNTTNIASAIGGSGNVRDGGGGSATLLSGTCSGHVLSVAVDFDNSKTYWRLDAGNWNNSGTADPATNTGGHAITTASGDMTGGWFPAASLVSNGDTVTLRTTAAQFTETMPSGFSAWDSSVALPILRRPLVIF